ncbi:unnamed protein product, partial [marine sediment metagenome]
MPNGDLEKKIHNIGGQPINIFSDLYKSLNDLNSLVKEIKD